MIELQGKYNNCKVFSSKVDEGTIGQLIGLLNQQSIQGNKIRVMPDNHQGKGCVIGTTMTLKDKVIPNLVGVDIGCFTGDTKVWCSRGVYVEIKKLADERARFVVDSFNEESKIFVNDYAIAFKTKKNAELVEVTYGNRMDLSVDNTHKVKCTPDHKFLVSSNPDVYYASSETTLEWIEAKDLKEGMRLVAEDRYLVVKSVKALNYKEDVYCLNVEENHNFTIEGGVIVHNCGMLTIKLKEKCIDLPKLDSIIRQYIPAGFEIHSESKALKTSIDIETLRCYPKANLNVMRAYQSIGTLGGGNHFIEIDKDSEDNLYLVIHTGSRNLGKQVAEYYQDLGYERIKAKLNDDKYEVEKKILIEKLKAAGQEKLIGSELEKMRQKRCNDKPSIPYELAYVEGQDFEDYIEDMKKVQMYAADNRAEIARLILKHAKLTEVERFETIHNYIDTDNMILRKGAVSAQSGEKLLIPINMRDGSLICIGKGNPDWNYSAPHGSGRLMSRSEAKQSLTVSEFKKTMKEAGIYSTSVGKDTLDESPMAYKPMEEIINNIKDTVDIIEVIKPIYNFKAGGE